MTLAKLGIPAAVILCLLALFGMVLDSPAVQARAETNVTVQQLMPPALYDWCFGDTPRQAIAVGNVVNAMLNQHMMKHHTASAVIKCVNERGVEMILTNPRTGRQAQICWVVEMMRYGILIVEKDGTEVTAFVKDRLSDDINAVLRYLKNTGYE